MGQWAARFRYRIHTNRQKQFVAAVPVPFALRHHAMRDGRRAIQDESGYVSKLLVWMGSCFLFVAAFGILIVVLEQYSSPARVILWKGLALIVMGIPAGATMLFFGLLQGSAITLIAPDPTGRLVQVIDSGTRDEIVVFEAPIEQIRVVHRPVRVTQKSVTWHGHALTLELGPACAFTLACLPTKERLDAWLGTSPQWIREIPSFEGSELKRRGYIELIRK